MTAKLTVVKPDGSGVATTVVVPAQRRTNVDLLAVAGIGGTGVFSVVVQSLDATRPLVSGYATPATFAAGRNDLGTSPAPTWYFAEGSANSFFTETITVLNPTNGPVYVVVDVVMPNADPIRFTHVIEEGPGRWTFDMNSRLGNIGDHGLVVWALVVNATDVVHSGGSGNNGGYHTNPSFLEELPNETHRSAKTNVYQRQLLVARVRGAGWTQRRAAAAAGVSVRTVAKWLGRASELEDRSSRPRRCPTRTDLVNETAIIRLRRTRATAWEISAALGIPRSTVTRVLGRLGLNRVTALDPVVPVQRYERARPGELLHVDAKRLGRIAGHAGHRIHGDRRTHIRGAGWETLHVAIDDATRRAYAEVLATDEGPACAAFLGRAVRWYSRRGIRVQRLLTDNALAYRGHRVRAVCGRWAIRHRFTRPYRPQTNGKAERLIQTLLRQWAYRWPFATSAARTAALRPYLRVYNHRRPHASLGRRSPWTCFREAATR